MAVSDHSRRHGAKPHTRRHEETAFDDRLAQTRVVEALLGHPIRAGAAPILEDAEGGVSVGSACQCRDWGQRGKTHT